MHKTLYIDIDEEITSIVDRFKKSENDEVVIVAPKNALLLQSIINLRLLKKEALRQKKKLIIVTQDKIGKKLIEKAGIVSRSKSDFDGDIEESMSDHEYEPRFKKEALEIKRSLEREEADQKENNIGTATFFGKEIGSSSNSVQKNKIAEPKQKIASRKKVPDPSASPKKRKSREKIRMSDIVAGERKEEKRSIPDMDQVKVSPSKINEEIETQEYISENTSSRLTQISMKKAESFFKGTRRSKKEFDRTRVGKSGRNHFLFLASSFFFAASLAAAFFFVPSAQINLILNSRSESLSLAMEARTSESSVDFEKNIIPARIEKIEKTFEKEFEATGNKSGGNKAIGKAVIYNEYSQENQPLVATTRLQTEDGKIFRIKSDIVVPGSSKIGDDSEPGAIEVDIIADSAGSQFNIESADMKIPGFSGNPQKFEKFYAKISKATIGGTAGEGKFITAQDIASAKNSLNQSAKKISLEEIEKFIPDERRYFESAVAFEVKNISVSENVGAENEKFIASAVLSISTPSFSIKDMEEIAKKKLSGPGNDKADKLNSENGWNFVLDEVSQDQSLIKFSAKGDFRGSSDIDREGFKRECIGKSPNQVEEISKNFPEIVQTEISIWPKFLKRIPLNKNRVQIQIFFKENSTS